MAARAMLEIDLNRGKVLVRVPDLIAALQDQDLGMRQNAVEALTKLGPAAKEAVPTLIVALKDDDKVVRYQTVQALGTIGPAERVVPALVAALTDKDPWFRMELAKVLGDLGPEAKEAVPTLKKALKEWDSSRQAHIDFLGALARIDTANTQEYVAALRKDLKHHESYKRLRVVQTLARIGLGAKEAVAELRILEEKDPDESVRQAAREGLKKILPNHGALPTR